MRIRWGRTVIAAASAAAIAMVPALAVTSASAAAPKTGRTPAAYVPLRGAHKAYDTVFNNVDYNGGPVMPSNTDYAVFWSPTGIGAYGAGAPPEYTTGIAQYFTDLAHDSGTRGNVDSVATQYNDATGAVASYAVTYGGTILDTDPYPQTQCPVNAPVVACLTDGQIQQELVKVVTSHHLKHDLSHEYFLFTPPHVESCFSNDGAANPPYGGCSAGEVPSSLAYYCAYHQNTSIAPMVLYSEDPYVTGVQGCDDGNHPNGPSDGALVGGLSHEHNESITDPLPNDAWTNGAGANHGLENGDQCDGQMGATLGTAPNGASYNQVINGHYYWYQEEWSNSGHTCLQRLPSPAPKPVAAFTAAAAGGTTMTFNASASSAPGGIARYVWQFNDSFGASTVEVTTPTISHTFPASGPYSIGLTIYGPDGTSTGAGGIVTTGRNGFTAGFRSAPAGPAAAHAVTFTALTEVSNQPVITYLWEFGDGTTGSTGQPTHHYARAGTYTVTLVAFSGEGSAYPSAGAGPIYSHAVTVR